MTQALYAHMNKKKNESTVKKKKKRTSETESQLQGAV
jgi:hypothetical protein